MSAPELVTVTIDGVEVRVPKGTGIVETALQAGIEIPVFCYEPRLGPPVGACRMCLCEVEPGPPKPAAACTLTAADGMIVRTAQTSPKAAQWQEDVLEFILVNHPLDCPVCDKGGECPLQDLTFRYGPGNTRMTFMKRTLEKPIPVSPTIALDRERCILCYRCTRFSEGVAEDGQLVAINRGAQSLIATFEDRPYRAPFSGNVIELCPVGALTSTQYRFQARPWEIQDVPSVCGLCPVGCNITVTTREGKVKRVLSRNHPEVDQGWLCDKGRFAFPHVYADDRIVDPGRKVGLRRFEDLSWEDAFDELERLARAAEGRVVLALSGSETLEQAQALVTLLSAGFGSKRVILPEEASTAIDAFGLPLSAIGEAQLIVVLGDEPATERAPLVDLWLKLARRNGAEVVEIGPAGGWQRQPGTAAAAARELAEPGNELGQRLRDTERAVLIWSGRGGRGGLDVAHLAASLGLDSKPGSGVFHLPATANGRAVAGIARAHGCEPASRDPIGLLLISGDDAAAEPRVRELAEQADAVVAIAMFADPLRGWADLVFPGTSYLERDGHMVNLEGRCQRVRRAVIPPAPDEETWLAEFASRFGIDLRAAATRWVEMDHATRVEAAEPLPDLPAPPAAPPTSHGGPLRLLRYRALFSGPVVERVTELQFQRPEPVLELSPQDAKVRGIEDGQTVGVSSNGTSVDLRARINPRLVAGAVRAAEEHVRQLAGAVEVQR